MEARVRRVAAMACRVTARSWLAIRHDQLIQPKPFAGHHPVEWSDWEISSPRRSARELARRWMDRSSSVRTARREPARSAGPAAVGWSIWETLAARIQAGLARFRGTARSWSGM